jgi:hypothetical protein
MDLTDEPGTAFYAKAIIAELMLTEIVRRCHRCILLIR